MTSKCLSKGYQHGTEARYKRTLQDVHKHIVATLTLVAGNSQIRLYRAPYRHVFYVANDGQFQFVEHVSLLDLVTSAKLSSVLNVRTAQIITSWTNVLGYNIDEEIELHDYGTASTAGQGWMRSMALDLARGGIQVQRDCKTDLKFSAMRGAIKACLMIQAAHRHQAPLEAASASLKRGWNF